MTERDFLGRELHPRLDHAPAWNGATVTAKRGTAIVADDSRFPRYWAMNLVGQRIAVVKVDAPHGVMYLDDRLGEGWAKMMNGGTARFGHAEVEIAPGSFTPVTEETERG